MHDELGARIKSHYEHPAQARIPRRTYTILRLDGKCFHTYTRGLNKPFDLSMVCAMDEAAMRLAGEMMGCQLGFGQSDEYSFLLTDFERPQTEAWFNGEVQKIVSIAASVFTAEFNARMAGHKSLAHFDCRVFTISDPSEVENYFIWRQNDASRNSLGMLAAEHFSHKELFGKSDPERHEMLHSKGVNWDSLPTNLKRGRVIRRVPQKREVTFTHKKTGVTETKVVEERAWATDYDIPVFTRDREYLRSLIPRME